MKTPRSLKFIFAATALVSLSGCADMILAARGEPSLFNGFKRTRRTEQRGAGLWSARIPDGDMDAEVGHPFAAYVSGSCESDKYIEKWTYRLSYSGTLPPGIALEGDRIAGIPTARGHYILHLKLYDSVCNGENYEDHDADLRIHVTGSGQVL